MAMLDDILNKCGNSTVWDSQLTWEAEVPDFTECFHKTILVCLPCAFLWVLSPFQMHAIRKFGSRSVPWTSNTFMKIMSGSVLVILSILECIYKILFMSENVVPLETYSSILRCGSMILALLYVYAEISKGMNSTGVMFVFWLLQTVCNLLTYRSILLQRLVLPPALHALFLLGLPLIITQLIFSCLTDKVRTHSDSSNTSPNRSPCPEKTASFFSRMIFSWVNGLIAQGYARPLTVNDLWLLDEENTAKVITSSYNEEWEKEKDKRGKFSVIRAIIRTYGYDFFLSAALKLCCDLLVFFNPTLLRRMIQFSSSNEPLWHGYYYAAAMFVAAMLHSLIINQHSHRMQYFATRVKTALMLNIYQKALRISTPAKRHMPLGELVNVMAIDTQVVVDMLTEVTYYWSAPIQLAIAFYMLWQMLGAAVCAGVMVMVVFIPMNTVIATTIKMLQSRMMKHRDDRLKMMNEVLMGIKVLKLYAWEMSFYEHITSVRKKELTELMKISYVKAFIIFLFHITPVLVSMATLGTYVMINDQHVLTASKVFVSLSLLQVMRTPLNSLPTVITLGLQAVVSLQRILDFINSDEFNSEDVQHNTIEDDVVVIENGTFSWGDGDLPAVINVNLHAKKGSLVVVIGPIGAGKSSLLISVLGELEKLSGTVNTVGSIAYVPQQAWIKNATLQKNILFGKPMDTDFYERVIAASALANDLEILPGGDFTEIGEKGVNVSGGQRQRISLARAVYSNSDIYLLDDPLSAVDSHVGKHIVEHVIGPYGILRKKTRILATHGIICLPFADYIYVMEQGKIIENGTFNDLIEAKGPFHEFLVMYMKTQSVIEEVSSYSTSEEAIKATLSIVAESASEESLAASIQQSKAEVSSRLNVLREMLLASIRAPELKQILAFPFARRSSLPNKFQMEMAPIIEETGRRFSYSGHTELSSVQGSWLDSGSITPPSREEMELRRIRATLNFFLTESPLNSDSDTIKHNKIGSSTSSGQETGNISTDASEKTTTSNDVSGKSIASGDASDKTITSSDASDKAITSSDASEKTIASDDANNKTVAGSDAGDKTIPSSGASDDASEKTVISNDKNDTKNDVPDNSQENKESESSGSNTSDLISSNDNEDDDNDKNNNNTLKDDRNNNSNVLEDNNNNAKSTPTAPTTPANNTTAANIALTDENDDSGSSNSSITTSKDTKKRIPAHPQETPSEDRQSTLRLRAVGERPPLPAQKSRLQVQFSSPNLSPSIVSFASTRSMKSVAMSTDSRSTIVHSTSLPVFAARSAQDMAPKTLSSVELEQRSKLITEEVTETGEVSWDIYFFYFLSLSYIICCVSFMLFILSEFCNVSGNVWLSNWSSDPPMPDGSQDAAMRKYRLQVYTILGIGQAAFMLFGTMILTFGTLRASQILHDKMLYSVMRSSMQFFDTTPTGRLMNRFAKDVEGVDEAVPRPLRPLVTHILHVVATVYIITLNTPTFILVTPPLSALYYFIQKRYLRTSRQLKRLEAVSRSPIFAQFSETVSGLITIRAYNQQARCNKEAEQAVDLNQVLTYPRIAVKRWLSLRLDFVGNLVVFSTAVFATYSRSSLDPGVVGLIISYAVQVTHLLSILVRMAGDFENNIVAVERIKQYTDTPQEEAEFEKLVPPPDWPKSGRIVFEDYCLRYREHLDLALKHVDISIEGGEKIGIVGRTGAGKSSMTLALFRVIEPTHGTIYIDDVDITQISLRNLRSQITIIPQDPILFSGTLRLNLDPLGTHNTEEITEVLHQAHLFEFVRNLPRGLDFQIVEGGENISAGQRQLVCLARALLRKSKVLILDEATAAVDLETDDLIQATIRKEFEDCTVLSIAHRLNTIMDCSRIIVLDAGAVAEFDSPANLLAKEKSIFRSLVEDAGILTPPIT